MNQPLSFIEDLKVPPVSETLRNIIYELGTGTLTNPAKIERALTPILVALEVMESRQVILNDLLEAKRNKRLKKAEKRQAKIDRKMEKWGMT